VFTAPQRKAEIFIPASFVHTTFCVRNSEPPRWERMRRRSTDREYMTGGPRFYVIGPTGRTSPAGIECGRIALSFVSNLAGSHLLCNHDMVS